MLLVLLHQVSNIVVCILKSFVKKIFIVNRSWKLPTPLPCTSHLLPTTNFSDWCYRTVQIMSVWASYHHMGKSGFLISHGWLRERRNLPCSFLDQGVFLSIMWVLVQGSEPYASARGLPCEMRWSASYILTELPAKLQSSFCMFLRIGLTRYKRNEWQLGNLWFIHLMNTYWRAVMYYALH